MSIAYKDDGIVIGVEGLSKVEKELGNVRYKLPAVEKFAINKTARYTRKIMIQQAKTRYALNAAGQRHLKDLQQKKKQQTATRQQSFLLHRCRMIWGILPPVRNDRMSEEKYLTRRNVSKERFSKPTRLKH